MATPKLFTNVAVSVQSALGASKTITAITKAAPGVVSSTHDFVNGDYVVLTVNGMTQLDGKVFRVCNVVGTTTFQLEDIAGGTGISTATYDVFTSGSAQKITFGTGLTSVASMAFKGGDFTMVDSSVIHGNQKREIQSLASPTSVEFTNNWDLSDDSQQVLKSLSDTQATTAFKIKFGSGTTIVFNGTVGYTATPAGNFGEVIKSSGTIALLNTPNYYVA